MTRTQNFLVSRRGLGLFGLAMCSPFGIAEAGPKDQGIGGTGELAAYFGAVTGFGSVVVNGVHIDFDAATKVTIDGRRARAAEIRVGAVVKIIALGTGRRPRARRIELAHEVVGPVESIGWFDGRVMVLGQRVEWPEGAPRPSLGETVAVSGLRRPDGVIVASLVQSANGAPSQVTGVVRRGPDGVATIHGLRLAAAPADIGEAVVVEGKLENGLFVAARISPAPAALRRSGAALVCVQAYAARSGDDLVLGESGLRLHGGGEAPAGPQVYQGRLGEGGYLVGEARGAESAREHPPAPAPAAPSLQGPDHRPGSGPGQGPGRGPGSNHP